MFYFIFISYLFIYFILENFGFFSWLGANAHYELSKMCNTLFANEVNRRMKEKGLNITANSLHPGTLMATGITHTNAAANFFVHSVLGWFTKSCAQGAATTIYCAFSTDLKGLFFFVGIIDNNNFGKKKLSV